MPVTPGTISIPSSHTAMYSLSLAEQMQQTLQLIECSSGSPATVVDGMSDMGLSNSGHTSLLSMPAFHQSPSSNGTHMGGMLPANLDQAFHHALSSLSTVSGQPASRGSPAQSALALGPGGLRVSNTELAHSLQALMQQQQQQLLQGGMGSHGGSAPSSQLILQASSAMLASLQGAQQQQQLSSKHTPHDRSS